MVEVKFEIGDGKFKSVAQILKQTTKRIDRLAKKGYANNNTISDKDLTNLQNVLVSIAQQFNAQKSQAQSGLENASLRGNVQQVQKLTNIYDKLVRSEQDFNQLFSGTEYQQVNNFNVKKSLVFQSNAEATYVNQVTHKLTDLAKEITQFRRSASTLKQRWYKSADSKVMTYERYQQYKTRLGRLQTSNGYGQQLGSLNESVNNRLDALKATREELNDQIASGNGTADTASQRSGIDEEIVLLEKRSQRIQELTEHVKKANESLDQADKGISTASTNKNLKILSPENSIGGQLRKHSSRILRTGLIAGIGGMARAWSRGNSSILGSFDNLKSATYQFGGNDKYIQNQMFGNNVGLNLTQASRYLNAFTSGQKEHDLSGNKARDLVNAWGGLATYNGATDTTTQNLEHTASDVADKGLSASRSERLANAIQQALTNSSMSAKANEQEQALSSMYNTAFQIGGGVSASGLRNIAGFQALMASGGSSMQGQAGAQAFSGLTNTLSDINNSTAWLLWGGAGPEYQSMNGRADLMQKMQEAPEKPWLYSTPIKNMLQVQSRATKNPKQLRKNVAMNLVEMSRGSLTMNQAEHLVKLQQEGKLTKKQIQKETKGKSKGGKSQYDKSGTKSIRDEQKAVNESEVKAARALNHFTKKLNWILQTFWVSDVASGMVSGATTQVAGSILTSAIKGGGVSSVFKKIAGKITGKETAKVAKTAGKGAIKKGLGKVVSGVAKHGGKASLIAGGVALGATLLSGFSANADSKSNGSSKSSGKSLTGGKGYSSMSNSERNRATSAGLADGSSSSSTGGNKSYDATDENSGKNSGQLLHGDNDSKKHESVSQLQKKAVSKHKLLVKKEWNLIDYLNTFWDVFLRKVKESSGDNDKDGGDASDPDGVLSKEEFTKLAKQAAKIMHVNLSQHDIDRLYHQAITESGANPAQGGGYDDRDGTGLPVGLFQFKEGTWEAAQRDMPSGHNNIHSALDQIIAVLADKTWRSDIEELGERRGWTPHGYSLGGIHNYATGGIKTNATVKFNRKLAHSNASSTAANDMRSIFERSLIHNSNNYIKSVKRNAPKFKVTIDTTQAKAFDKDSIINAVINGEFNNWLSQKQQAKLINYYQNETSGLFV